MEDEVNSTIYSIPIGKTNVEDPRYSCDEPFNSKAPDTLNVDTKTHIGKVGIHFNGKSRAHTLNPTFIHVPLNTADGAIKGKVISEKTTSLEKTKNTEDVVPKGRENSKTR